MIQPNQLKRFYIPRGIINKARASVQGDTCKIPRRRIPRVCAGEIIILVAHHGNLGESSHFLKGTITRVGLLYVTIQLDQ